MYLTSIDSLTESLFAFVVEEGPRGYPRLAKFLDSDECFMNYRKFGYLQARVLLTRQEELRRLEDKLDNADVVDSEACEGNLLTCDTEVIKRGRKELIDTIESKFRQYGKICDYTLGEESLRHGLAELLIVARDLALLNPPTARDYESVRSYLAKLRPIYEEQEFIKYKEDLVSLKPGREHSYLDVLVEKLLFRARRWKVVYVRSLLAHYHKF
jgi:hypothetical protein